jgi:hypothetical protein
MGLTLKYVKTPTKAAAAAIKNCQIQFHMFALLQVVTPKSINRVKGEVCGAPGIVVNSCKGAFCPGADVSHAGGGIPSLASRGDAQKICAAIVTTPWACRSAPAGEN